MLTLRLPADATGLPLHERVAAALRRAVGDGEVAPGALLPPARDVAAALAVHPNTVLRAYRALRDEGLLELRAGRGARVLPGAPGPAALAGPVDELLRAAARAGVATDELLALVRSRAVRPDRPGRRSDPDPDPDPEELR